MSGGVDGPDGPKTRSQGQRAELREAILAEYTTLRSEIQIRIGTQKQIINWLLTLTLTTIGAFLTLKVSGDDTLLLKLIQQPLAVKAVVASGIICGVFTLGVEVLLSFWVYQLYMVHRMSDYIMCVGQVLGDMIGLSNRELIFGWERVGCVLDVGIFKELPRRNKSAQKIINAAGYIQPVFPYALVAVGLVCTSLAFSFLWIEAALGQVACAIALSCILFLLLGIATILVVHVVLSKDHQIRCKTLSLSSINVEFAERSPKPPD